MGVVMMMTITRTMMTIMISDDIDDGHDHYHNQNDYDALCEHNV